VLRSGIFETRPTTDLNNEETTGERQRQAPGTLWWLSCEKTDSEEEAMRENKIGAIVIKCFALLVGLGTTHQAMAQDAATTYAKMAPLEQYVMADRDAEIALARSAAPDSISRDAEVLLLGRHGFETAAKGKNGFVCIVGRGWTSAADEDYWNPKVRVPMCVNAAAARSYLLRTTKITNLALAGRTLAQVNEAMAAAIARKELPPMESGAMCYMMFEARIRRRQRATLAFAPYVFLFRDRSRGMGSESAGFSSPRDCRPLGAPDPVRHSNATVVRRNGRSSFIAGPRASMTCCELKPV
jgi:hypothetical protein